MAVSFLVNTSTAGAGPLTTTGIDTSGADFIVLGFACQDPYDGTPTDSKSNTWTQAAVSYTRTNVRVRMWYSIPSSVGSAHTFTAPADATPDQIAGVIFVQAFSGVKQTTPEDQINGTNNFSATLQPGSITPSENNELIVTLFGNNAANTPISIDSGFTETNENAFSSGVNYGGAMAYLIQTTAAAVNPTWTRTGTNGNAGMQVSFKAAAAAATSAIKRRMMMGAGQ